MVSALSAQPARPESVASPTVNSSSPTWNTSPPASSGRVSTPNGAVLSTSPSGAVSREPSGESVKSSSSSGAAAGSMATTTASPSAPSALIGTAIALRAVPWARAANSVRVPASQAMPSQLAVVVSLSASIVS